ncbi:Hydroxyacylglutathione hydrolase [compost metagenome]
MTEAALTPNRPYVELLPIFEDNYVFVLVNPANNEALAIDPGEPLRLLEFLEEKQINLKGILLTHHHNDHIGGVKDLKAKLQVPIWAPLKNKHQIPDATHYVQEGNSFEAASFKFAVMELPGHTLGHVAYWMNENRWLFSGDVLFGLGCGRLFEGTPEQAYESLGRLKKLPPETLVYCTHEYTETNLRFCKMLSRMDDSPLTGDDESLELYENELLNKRSMGLPSVPLKLSIEIKVNPFLLANNVRQFANLRELRNMQM